MLMLSKGLNSLFTNNCDWMLGCTFNLPLSGKFEMEASFSKAGVETVCIEWKEHGFSSAKSQVKK